MCFLHQVILETPVPTLVNVSNMYGTGGRICREGFTIKMGGKYVFVQVIGG